MSHMEKRSRYKIIIIIIYLEHKTGCTTEGDKGLLISGIEKSVKIVMPQEGDIRTTENLDKKQCKPTP